MSVRRLQWRWRSRGSGRFPLRFQQIALQKLKPNNCENFWQLILPYIVETTRANGLRQFCSRFVAWHVACSPISDPSVMRVSEALRGKERLDDDQTTEAE